MAQNDVLYRDEKWLAYLVDRIPLRRPGIPADLDGATVFMASEASRSSPARPCSWTAGSPPALPEPCRGREAARAQPIANG